MGSGRVYRGTAHTVFIAFCRALPTPSPPYSAPAMPMITAVVPPLRASGWLSWSLITGNWSMAALTIWSRHSGRPESTTPSIVVSSRSSGNSETNA